MEWISVNEQTPVIGSYVLCWDEDESRIKQAMVYQNEVGDVFFDVAPQSDPPEFVRSAYWMPPPDPPA